MPLFKPLLVPCRPPSGGVGCRTWSAPPPASVSVPLRVSLGGQPRLFVVPGPPPRVLCTPAAPQPSTPGPRAPLLQTVPGQLDLLVSACAVGVGCCFAAPVGGKFHFLPIPVGLRGCVWWGGGCSHKLWDGVRVGAARGRGMGVGLSGSDPESHPESLTKPESCVFF